MLEIPPAAIDVKYLLVLLHTFCSSNAKKVLEIIHAFPEYNTLVEQSDELLQQLGLGAEQIALVRAPNWCEIENELAWAEQHEQQIITFFTAEYPSLLREIYNPPLLLFAKGNKNILSVQQLAIVGSRNPTPSGIENAYTLAKDLVGDGWCVTSGMALGIDAAAHRGALTAQGNTIAVMGAGLNNIYPSRHKNLAEEIVAKGGLLLSEFPLSCAPLAKNFPQRNRVISGLSLGTIVVEATLKSGSLITARLAAEQGREVFALPGSVNNPLARGCHEIIRQGAKLVENVADILLELPGFSKAKHSAMTARDEDNKLPPVYQKLLQAIDDVATPLDTIVARSSLTIKEIMSMLVHLELQGKVQKVAGGYVLRRGVTKTYF